MILSQHFGGKLAKLPFLRHSLPDQSGFRDHSKECASIESRFAKRLTALSFIFLQSHRAIPILG